MAEDFLSEQALHQLAEILGHRFEKPGRLRLALTHPSAAGPQSYQRLEFLGDRVLGLIVAEMLFKRFPEEAEGALARRHAALVRRESLAEVAAAIGLGQYMILAEAEAEAGGQENPAILADGCEAVIAALYMDGGLAAAKSFVEPQWEPLMEADRKPPQDPKTALQEWAQGRGLPLPVYRELKREGPPHEPCFTIEVSVQGHEPQSAEGRSKRQAESAAAEQLLLRVTGKAP